MSQIRSLLFCFFGVFFCYLLFGFAQEKITRGDFDGERFTYPMALVFVQCIFNIAFAKFMITFITMPEADQTSRVLFASCGFCYSAAMVASNNALQFISYPKQVLGKACKPIPVMLLGVFLAGKRYPLAKYLCILMIVAGVATFMYKDGKATDDDSMFDFGIGEILLLVSLTLDGLTGVTQEKMRTNYSTTQHHMMLNINLWACIFLGTGACVTGETFAFMSFVGRHPIIIRHLLAFSLMSALGQHFIFMTVVKFGPLTRSIITTTRKFFTILCSVIIFQNPMSGRQWIATAVVFAGLSLDAIYGRSVAIKKKSPEATK